MKSNGFGKSMKKLGKSLKKNSPRILTGIGIAGFFTAGIMAVKVTPKAKERLDAIEENAEDLMPEGVEIDSKEAKRHLAWMKFKAVAPLYAPSIGVAAGSSACIICSDKIDAKRQATLATTVAMSKEAFKTYQEKVIEKIGKNKEQEVRDEVDKKAVEENPMPDDFDLALNDGDMYCYDRVVGRYFKSNPDAIRKAESVLNRRLMTEMYISLNEFYDELNLPHIDIGDDLGFNVDEGIDINFSSQLMGTRPVLVISYDYDNRYDFRRLM